MKNTLDSGFIVSTKIKTKRYEFILKASCIGFLLEIFMLYETITFDAAELPELYCVSSAYNSTYDYIVLCSISIGLITALLMYLKIRRMDISRRQNFLMSIPIIQIALYIFILLLF